MSNLGAVREECVLRASTAVKAARESSALPKWCLLAISRRAYEEDHSGGQCEVDSIECGMIYDFEQAMKNEQDKKT